MMNIFRRFFGTPDRQKGRSGSATIAPPGIENEFFHLWETTLMERTAKLLSTGQPTDNEEIAKHAVNRASEIIMNKYGLSTSQMVAIIGKAFDSNK
ncbi:DUF2786 domain-containing protein [Candidatus Roizmanbacteria bacterium]|nr:DUF2786 domain-containing protein [Candidatus Roizmanbacteria bacterium]